MSGYRVAYVSPGGIEYALNDNVLSFLRRDGMVGFEPMDVDLPGYRRPLRDGVRKIGRPYTAPRTFGVLTDVLHDSHSDLAAYIAAKVHAINPYEDEENGGAVKVYTPDGRTRQIDAWPTAFPSVNFNGPVVCFLGYRFYAPYPFFYDPVLQSATFALSTPGGITFPITFPITFAATTIDTTETLSNDGEVATWPVITIYGPGDDPIITNNTTGAVMDLTNASGIILAAGDYIVVDMEAATILYHDASGPTDTYIPEKRTVASKFWQLVVGDNEINVTMTNVTVGSIKLEWVEFYRSGY
jgi:hypothetical protein